MRAYVALAGVPQPDRAVIRASSDGYRLRVSVRASVRCFVVTGWVWYISYG